MEILKVLSAPIIAIVFIVILSISTLFSLSSMEVSRLSNTVDTLEQEIRNVSMDAALLNLDNDLLDYHVYVIKDAYITERYIRDAIDSYMYAFPDLIMPQSEITIIINQGTYNSGYRQDIDQLPSISVKVGDVSRKNCYIYTTVRQKNNTHKIPFYFGTNVKVKRVGTPTLGNEQREKTNVKTNDNLSNYNTIYSDSWSSLDGGF